MLRNIFNTIVTRSLASLINLFVAIVISHVYGAEIRGEQGLILTTITIVTLLTAVIGAGSINFLVPREKVINLLIPSTAWNILTCFIVYLVLMGTNLMTHQINLHILILSFLATQSQINIAVLLGFEKIKASNYISLINTVGIFLSIFFCVFVLKVRTVNAYIYSLYFGYSLSLVLSCYYMHTIKYDAFDPFKELIHSSILASKNLFKYGILNQLDNFAQILSFRFSYYLIDYYFSKSAVGVYSNAISIIESIWLISRSITTVQNARIVNSKDLNYSVKISIDFFKISFFLVFIAMILLLLIPSDFYQFMFGKEFGEVKTVILSISPGILFFSTAFILNGLFSGTGDYIYNTISSIISLVVTVTFGIILIPRMGLIGAGITGSLAYSTNALVKLIFFLSKYKVSLQKLMPNNEDFSRMRELYKSLK
jgi:O-antigen/teichoic acid export membrane protein